MSCENISRRAVIGGAATVVPAVAPASVLALVDNTDATAEGRCDPRGRQLRRPPVASQRGYRAAPYGERSYKTLFILWPWLLRGLVLHAVRSLNSRRGPASIWPRTFWVPKEGRWSHLQAKRQAA
jgi:hypothetical protein